ncbi:MAG: HDIG domain-containing protein [Firmicutes bacterium]|nr:HDIG domain-containing protein [Bacillota bacterium]
MKEKQTKNKNAVSIILFFLLFLFMAAMTFVKFMLPSPEFKTEMFLGYICVAAALMLMVFVYALYCFMTRTRIIREPKQLALICVCMALSFAACIFCELLDAYLMPVFLTAFLLSPLVKRRDTLMANIICVMCVTVGLAIQQSLLGGGEIIPYLVMFVVGIFGGSIVAFALSYERKRLDFLVKGLGICAACIVLVFALSYPVLKHGDAATAGERFLYLIDRGKWAAIAIFAQLLLVLLLQPVLERVFNLLTNPRLIELTDHHSPLIKRLIAEAPGTFNHSLTVAGFAEVCATAIGENPYLARACAYYHDIGKLNRPYYFKENQDLVNNPHDNILPEVSVQIIRGHTFEGYKLCKQHHIPEEVARITTQHHGTMPIPVFYFKAQSLTDGEVNVKDYSYGGDTPSSKIEAIIMICDSAEAALRAIDAPTAEKAQKLLGEIVGERIARGQFDDCPITLKELATIESTIAASFGGVFHKRLKYPGGEASGK